MEVLFQNLNNVSQKLTVSEIMYQSVNLFKSFLHPWMTDIHIWNQLSKTFRVFYETEFP
jgi:hypothetical protein